MGESTRLPPSTNSLGLNQTWGAVRLRTTSAPWGIIEPAEDAL